MRKLLLAISLTLLPFSTLMAQWSSTDLQASKDFYDQLDSAALIVMHRGEVVVSWGDVDRKYNVASIRKSLLNALYGIAYDRNWIDLDKTLKEMGIDDTDPPLSDQEKSARLEDLLRSRSGIVHRSLYDAGWWDEMPERGRYGPGEFWIYNNWDFNALGTIWEQETGTSIHDSFLQYIAAPLGMEDYSPDDMEYHTRRNWAERMRGNTSDHRLYLFKMTARDLAKFGQLYLNQGIWNGEQILSRDWIARTMNGIPTEYESRRFYTKYGYLWWVDSGEDRRFKAPNVEGDAYIATGARGHYIYIAPECELVVVHSAETPLGASLVSQLRRRYFGNEGIQDWQFTLLLERLVDAGPQLNC